MDLEEALWFLSPEVAEWHHKAEREHYEGLVDNLSNQGERNGYTEQG